MLPPNGDAAEGLESSGGGGDGKAFRSYADADAPPKPGLNVDPDLMNVVGDMRMKSPAFDELARALEASDNVYKLRPGPQPRGDPGTTICPLFESKCTSIIDLDQIPKTRYAIDPAKYPGNGDIRAQMTLERAIAHELSHSYSHAVGNGWYLFDPHRKAIANENKIMDEIDSSSPDRDPNNDSLFQN
jgi:hypothetical protein